MTAAIRVVVVEASPIQRTRLITVLERTRDITVVGEVHTAGQAADVVARLRPDVVLLDLQIDDGGDRSALAQTMASTPTPVVVLSSSDGHPDSVLVAQALAAGAVLALPRPGRWTPEAEDELRRGVRTASRVRVRSPRRVGAMNGTSTTVPTTPPDTRPGSPRGVRSIVAIGASTGGPGALATVLGGLGGLTAPVLVVQHMHADFVAGLVQWMARVSALPVELAAAGQVVRPGRVYIGPGGAHLRVRPGLRLELDPEPMSVHRPSVDELFRSVAELPRVASIAVVLTGMGDDGARGLLQVRRQGGRTIAQDEATSAVFGMPRAAFRLGAADFVLPLPKIAARILTLAREVAVP
ncbi:MAG TPA: chemotaxis protein CheB [Micromonosporaceae bacterium]|nr:chemotaxis protein CheB [Micromonosporaceae bacterium]